MGKIAFVFSGQGDQYPGMGKELCETSAGAAAVFAMCDRLRPGTSEQCFTGTVEELRETKNTQPCLFATELAAVSVLAEKGIYPDAAAGFSLGEVAACTAAGLVDPETGFRLVCCRGERMQAAAEKHETSMAAVVKLTGDRVEELCSRYSAVYPVNYNCPGQVSVAGLKDQMTDFAADVKAAGGRAIPLKVNGAFHSPFMKEASDAFRKDLINVSFQKGNIVLYSNVTAQPYGEDAAELLAEQICHPVRWEALIRNMISSGVDTFIEIGPGKTLTGMIQKIDDSVRTYAVSSDLSVLVAEVGRC